MELLRRKTRKGLRQLGAIAVITAALAFMQSPVDASGLRSALGRLTPANFVHQACSDVGHLAHLHHAEKTLNAATSPDPQHLAKAGAALVGKTEAQYEAQLRNHGGGVLVDQTVSVLHQSRGPLQKLAHAFAQSDPAHGPLPVHLSSHNGLPGAPHALVSLPTCLTS